MNVVYFQYHQQYEHVLLVDKMRNHIELVTLNYVNISSDYLLDIYVNTSPSTYSTVG